MSNFGALDMALDDVISQNRKQRKATNTKQNATPARRGNTSRGGINKNRAPAKRSSPYNAGARPTRNNNVAPKQQQQGGNSLVVSNLHFNVTEKDLYDLFGQIGPVKRAFLHIGPNGKSAGIADVVFHNNNDATRARTTYNNVELDNRPMHITTASVTTAISSITNKTNNRRGNLRNSNLRGANNRRNNRPSNGRNRQNRPKPNEQDLDADMDSYMGSAE